MNKPYGFIDKLRIENLLDPEVRTDYIFVSHSNNLFDW
jgi:hypothetical protein